MSKKKGPTKKVDEEEDPYGDDFVEPPVKKDDSWRGKHGRKKTAFLREAKGAVTPPSGDGFVLSPARPAFSPSSEPETPKSPEERASAAKKLSRTTSRSASRRRSAAKRN